MTTATIPTTTADIPAADALPAPESIWQVLRHRDFFLYFSGQLISISGSWMQIAAQGWLVFHLTQSELWLGVVAFASGLPMLLLAPLAGVWVDRAPRRQLLMLTQSIQMVLAFMLAALVWSETVQIWQIVCLAFLFGMTNALDAPSRQAFIKDLAGKENIPNGIRLNSLMFNLSRVFGPSIGGVILVAYGAAVCFFINGVSFLVVLVCLLIMRTRSQIAVDRQARVRDQLIEGVRFVRQHPIIGPILVLAVIYSMTVANLTNFLPAYAAEVLRSPKEALSAMSALVGIGAVMVTVFLPRLHKRFGRGRVILGMGFFNALMIFCLALNTQPVPALALSALCGFSMIGMFVTMNTLIQTVVPDQFRGRVLSLYTLTFFGLAPFGALLLGVVGQYYDIAALLQACALVALFGAALITLKAPQLRAAV
jgi:MFS family permease